LARQSDQTVSLDLVQLYQALGGGWGKNSGPSTASLETRNQ
jgi:outer membrane protein TolC